MVKERLVIVQKLHYIVIEVPVLPCTSSGFSEAPLVCYGLGQVDNVVSALVDSPLGRAPGVWRGPLVVALCSADASARPLCNPAPSCSSPASPPGAARDSGSAPAQRFPSPRLSARPQASIGEAWSTVTNRRSRGGYQTKHHAAWDQGERQRMRSAVSWERARSKAAQELNAALLLQRAVRVVLARKHVRTLRLALKLKAVHLLQRAVRGMWARRQARLLRLALPVAAPLLPGEVCGPVHADGLADGDAGGLLGAMPVPAPRKSGRRRLRGSGAAAPDVDGLLSDDMLLAAATVEAEQQREDLAGLDELESARSQFKPCCGRCRRAMAAGTISKRVSCGHCVSANPARRPCLIPRGVPALFCDSARCDSGMCIGCVRKAVAIEQEFLSGEHG